MIKVNDEHLGKAFNYKAYAKKVTKIDAAINDRTGAGSDFLGWENLPSTVNQEEIEKIENIYEMFTKFITINSNSLGGLGPVIL